MLPPGQKRITWWPLWAATRAHSPGEKSYPFSIISPLVILDGLPHKSIRKTTLFPSGSGGSDEAGMFQQGRVNDEKYSPMDSCCILTRTRASTVVSIFFLLSEIVSPGLWDEKLDLCLWNLFGGKGQPPPPPSSSERARLLADLYSILTFHSRDWQIASKSNLWVIQRTKSIWALVGETLFILVGSCDAVCTGFYSGFLRRRANIESSWPNDIMTTVLGFIFALNIVFIPVKSV